MADQKALVIDAGTTKRIPNADTLLAGAGVKSSAGALTISSMAGNTVLGSSTDLAANVNLTALAGTGAIDFSLATGLFKTSTGAVTVGPGAVTVSGVTTLTAAGTALTVNNNTLLSGTLAVTGATTHTGATNVNGGLQRSTGGTLLIGTDANTTALTIGSVGVTATVAGNLSVSGTETVVGTTSFEGAITFKSNVTVGDGVGGPDTLAFDATTGRLGSSGLPHVHWLKEVNHTFDIDGSTTVGVVGGSLTIQAASGANASGVSNGAVGGVLILNGGTGGVGASTLAAGVGGVINLIGGTGGDVSLGTSAGTGGSGIVRGGTGGAGAAAVASGTGGQLQVSGGNAGSTGTGPGAGGGLLLLTGGDATGNGSGGDATLRGGALAGSGLNGLLTIGATSTRAVNIGASGITTTITGGLTQLTGAVSLAGNAASSFTTSAGALTITSAAAATWSTSAGALTLTSAAATTWSTASGALTINGTAGLNLQSAATAVLNLTSTTAVVQAGVILSTTGTGNINLPNNASARFQVEGVAVSANVTAANLGTLTAGATSNADALHTHTGVGAVDTRITTTSGEAISIGEIVAIDDAAGVPRLFKADANGAGELVNPIGIAFNTVAGAGLSVTVIVAGERSIADTEWDAVPVVADVGKKVFLSETAGNWTLTAPSTAGSTVIRTGVVTQGGAGAVKVVWQLGEGVVL